LDRNDPLATSGHKSDRQKNQPNTLDAYPVYLAGYRMILNYINYIPETMYYWAVILRCKPHIPSGCAPVLSGMVLCKTAESFEIFEIAIVR
jgi:hypothetical protein